MFVNIITMADRASTPLLNSNAVTRTDKPSPFATGTINLLGAAKLLLGVAFIAAPRLSAKLFLFDVTPQAVVPARLFGTACAAVGAITYVTNQWASQGKIGRPEMRQVMVFNILEDAVDVATCTIGFTSGMFGAATFGVFGGGCAALAAMGAVGLVGLRK